MKYIRNKKILTIIFSAIILACIAAAGVTFAVLSMKTAGTTNTFKKGVVNISVDESRNEDYTEKKSIKVKNNGNTGVYVRVKLVSYWAGDDGEGNYYAIGKESEPIDQSCLNLTDWYYDSVNDTYYCKKPVGNSASSPDLIKSGKTLKLAIDEFGNRQVIEVLAQAVQASPSDAVEDVWNVTLDDSGAITGIKG